MILELLKFAIIFFLPTILGRALGWYRNLSKLSFSWMSWGKLKWSNKFISLIGIGYVVVKLVSMFVYGHANFYITIQSRMDSPGYILRGQYRNYVAAWESSVPEVAILRQLKSEGKDLSDFHDRTLLKEFEDMEYLSEQLKLKEKKKIYSKFGEHAFLECKYCTKDLDYILFLVPELLWEYSIFLIVVGLITSQNFKSKWRNHVLSALIIALLIEANGFYLYEQSGIDLYTAIFGEDFFTLQIEKTIFIREVIFVAFTLIILIFDLSQDNQVNEVFMDVTRSLEASLALLQSTRLQKAAISLNEDLKKYALDSLKKQKFKFADIISDQAFRAKVSESGSHLEMEQMIKHHSDTIDKLLSLVDNKQ